MGDTLNQDYKYSMPSSFGSTNGKVFVPNFLLASTPWQYPQSVRESVGGYFGLNPKTVTQDIGAMYKNPIVGDRRLDPNSPWTGLAQKEPTDSLFQKLDAAIMDNKGAGTARGAQQYSGFGTGMPINRSKIRQQSLKDVYASMGITPSI
jgi:hypothetical protein